jgi:hypothetical protein
MMTKGTALAPSQHIRSTLGKPRTRRTTIGSVALVAASLMLSACGAQQAGAAAIVNGNTISDQDVQTASLQLDTLAQAQAQQQVSPRLVLLNLILAPYVLAEASRTGKGVPDAQALKAIPKVANPSRSTIDFVRMQLAIPSLSQASKDSILTKLNKATITVNPRYGTLDVKQAALTPTSPDWIKASTASVAP